MVLSIIGKILTPKTTQNVLKYQGIIRQLHGINKSPLLERNLRNIAQPQIRFKSIKWCKKTRRKCPEPPEKHAICKKPCEDAPPRQDDIVKGWPKKIKQRTWLYCREPCPKKIHTCLDDPPPCVCIDPKYESYFKKPPCW